MISEPSVEELTQLQWQIGRKRITWATKHFTRFHELPGWQTMEANPRGLSAVRLPHYFFGSHASATH